MKKFIYVLAAAAALVACNNKEPQGPDGPQGGDQTPTEPTSLQINATSPFAWAKADKVSILDGKANNMFRSQGAGTTAVLAGEALAVKPLYGFAPYDESASLSGSAVLASVPTAQVLTADKLSPVVAGLAEDGQNMEFKAVAGFVKITFAEDAKNITALGVASINGEAIAGPVEVKFEGGNAVVSAKSETATVSATAFEETFKSGASYCVAVLPGTYQGGFTVSFTFKGAPNEIKVKGPVAVKAGEAVELATIERPLTAVEKLLIGEWELKKFASGDWVSTNLGEDRAVPGPCKGDVIEFKMDGTVAIDLGEDGVTYCTTLDDVLTPNLTGEETWSLAEDDTVLKLSGEAFPLILGDRNGLSTDYRIVSISAAELVLEYLFTDTEGTPDVPFKAYLQPKGMKRYYHSLKPGDFGIYDDGEGGGYTDGGFQPLTVDGITWTLEAENRAGAEIDAFGWFGWGALRMGAWGGEGSAKKAVFKTSSIKGNIKAVTFDIWHQEDFNDAADYSVTVGGQPFGGKSLLKGTSTPCTAASSEPAQGEIVVTVEANSEVEFAIILRSMEVVYTD